MAVMSTDPDTRTPDYTSIAFQGWREDGVLHLPDVLPTTRMTGSGYLLRRPRQISSESHLLQTKKPRVVQTSKHLPKDRLFLLRACWKSVISDQLSGSSTLLEKRDRFSRCSLGMPHFRDCHAPNEMSKHINTALSQNLNKLHIGPHDFTLFSKLPAELRLKIYGYALPRERLVEVVLEKWIKDSTYGFSYTVCKLRPTSDAPAMLRLCSESRVEALKTYSLMFGVRHSLDPLGGAKTYFDPHVDILFMNCHRFPEMRFSELLNIFDPACKKVKHAEDVVNLCFCVCLIKNILEEIKYAPAKELLKEGLTSLKRLICVSHGVGSLSKATLVPNPEWAPAILEPAEIASLEGVWGLKPELMIAKSESWDWTCYCAKVENK